MRRPQTWRGWGLALVLGVLAVSEAGCLEGPLRNNPLDPHSPDFEDEGRVTGHVANRASEPLPGVTVRLTQLDTTGVAITSSFTTQSGEEGQFRLTGVPSDTYRLLAEKEGFGVPFVDTLAVEPGQVTNAGRIILNALPVFTRYALHTVHLQQAASPEHVFYLEAEAQVADPDNQPGIARVLLTIPAHDYTAELLPTLGAPDRFVRSLPENALPTPTLQALSGEPMHFVVRDRDGATSRSDPLSLVRVIEEAPAPLVPQGAVTRTTLTFSWEPVHLPYPITYRLDVVRLEGSSEVLAGRYEAISSDSTSLRVTLDLPPEERPKSFYWTVSVVDAYGDRARSQPMSFRVE